MTKVDSDDGETVARMFGIADALAREIAFMNDEWSYTVETPEARYSRMRAWVERQIKP